MHSEHAVNTVNAPYSVNSEYYVNSVNTVNVVKMTKKIAFSVYCNDITIGLDLVNITNINQ